jgi:hypothetical protein
VKPRSKLTDADRQLIRQHKTELLTLLVSPEAEHPASERLLRNAPESAADIAEKALGLLDRWKCYIVPGGRMAEVRQLAAKLSELQEPAALLRGLQDFERDLIAVGGEYDRELAEAVAIVEFGFPGARLVKFKQ